MGDKDRWSISATKNLIREYEKHDFLHNPRHENYKNRDERQKAYREIEGVMVDKGFNYNVMDIKKKLNGLRSQYMAEKLKIANSIRSGADGDNVYKPVIYWFVMLKFLDSFTNADESVSNLDEETAHVGFTHEQEQLTTDEGGDLLSLSGTEVPSTSRGRTGSSTSTKKKCNKRKAVEYEPDDLLHNASRTMAEISQIIKDHTKQKTNETPQTSDSVDIFCQFVNDELKGIRDAGGDVYMRQVKRKIQNVLMQSWEAIDSAAIEILDSSDVAEPDEDVNFE